MTLHTFPDRDSWLTWRESHLGASEAATVFGLDRFNSPFTLASEKMGLLQPSRTQTVRTRLGELLEDDVLTLLEEFHGIRATTEQSADSNPYMCAVHPELEWMSCTPDAMAYAGTRGDFPLDSLGRPLGIPIAEAEQFKVNLQIKTADTFIAADWANGPPLYYQVQVQHEMEVLQDSPVTVLVVLFGLRELKFFYVPHEKDWCKNTLLPRLTSFWNSVQAGEFPDLDESESTYTTLRAIKTQEIEGEKQLGEPAKRWVDEYLTAQAGCKAYDKMKARARNELCNLMGGPGKARTPSGAKVTWTKDKNGKQSFRLRP